jgi:hypothetical protein
VTGTQIVHLARTEARSDAPPALFAICPSGSVMTADLELVPSEDEHLVVWCEPCRSYLDHITPAEPMTVAERAEMAEEAKRILRSSFRAAEHPTPLAPAWMLEREGDGA